MTETQAAGTAAGEPHRASRPPKRCRAATRRVATASHSGPVAPDAATPQLSPVPRARVSPVDAPASSAVRTRPASALARFRWARIVPSPARTPFTLGYAVVLVVTGLFSRLADPDLVHDVLTHSSTDVVNLSDRPVLVLFASAVWVAGGVLTPYILAFLLVVGALERRLGGWRTAGVFLLGHVLATLMTELPVAASVAAGQLPDSSLRRLDYGISYGLLACTGALAGLLWPRLRWTLLGGITLVLVLDLVEFTDPLTDCGHLLALTTGVLCWPYIRRAVQRREPGPSGRAPRSA
ncbi:MULTISPECIES: rhomboid-like protein [Streptomyces]|uniref:rhomboid-like protein n=1 Tax=Streptomyces TaxID=1883 RepID=UPI001EE6650B|nr:MULTISPECIES: rhomboid-like protein [Streptomyces]